MRIRKQLELRERDSGGASATYTFLMPAGKTWTFHQWIHDNTVYLDNYVESAGSVLSTVFIGNTFEQDLAVSGGIRTYYYLGGKRVATGNATGLYFIHGDQLGSASLVTSITGTMTTQMLFKPYGLVRYWTGTLETDYRFTGQRQDSYINMYEMGARWYDNQLGRFISADSIVPGAANPQSFNRYSYAFNDPLRFVDPSGHDPLDDQWRKAFYDEHQRDPDTTDELIRLFSIAFPGEWDSSKFYGADGMHISEQQVDAIFTNNSASDRTWANMPNALEKLAAWYAPNESEAYVRDVGALFGGLPTRTEKSSSWAAASEEPLPRRFWARMQRDPQNPITHDADGNVHHFAWALVLGYDKTYLALAINTAREIDQAKGPENAVINDDSMADVWMGNRAALLGMDLRFNGVSPSNVQGLWGFDMMLRFP